MKTYLLSNMAGCYFASSNKDTIEDACKYFARDYCGKGWVVQNEDERANVTFANNRAYIKNLKGGN